MKPNVLLTVDGVINLALGVLLIWFPDDLVDWLGVPAAASGFYPAILGAVLLGIGIALLLELRPTRSGLGLGGAVAINLCGGVVLGGWLLFGDLGLPTRGLVVLWTLVGILVGISVLELMVQAARRGRGTQ